MLKLLMIKIYTDGSYKPTTGQGGYASVITENNVIVKILHQGYTHTTNNRAELMGVLYSLEYFKEPKELEIYSDSSYIVNSINNGHVEKWISEQDGSKKNMDLWCRINKLLHFHNVKFFWIKGHNNNKFNELADCYANISATVINPKEDVKLKTKETWKPLIP